MKFNPKTLSKSKHGLAYVSNVDGRGIFSVCGIFKRGEKASTLIYDLVNILCYVGGEIRDGFFVEKLREHELVPMLERNFSMAAEKAIFQPAPIEEAAKLLVLPCYEKAKAGGVIDLFVNREVKRSFEFFERVSQLCAYSDEEDFILAKGGSQIKKPFVYFDLQRPEFNAWWMEKSELEQLECSLPPVPMKFPEPGKLLLDGDSMIDFMSAASNERSKISTWKKKTLEKLSTAVNFDRLCGMSRHQALWYTWKGDLKMGITMLDSAKKIRDDQNAGRMLNSKVPVVDLFVTLTQIKLEKMGQCEGQSNEVYWQLSKGCVRETCPTTKDVDYDECFLGTCTCLKGSLEVFLEHSFPSLYWKNKPTLPMTEALIEEAVIEFVNAIDCDNFDPYDWAETCATILEEMMARYCCTKLSGKDISEVGQLFKEAFKAQVVQKIQKIEELPQYSSFCNDKASLHQLSSVMAARAIAPSVASHFLFTWKTMTPTCVILNAAKIIQDMFPFLNV